jgi:hypothetical protein
MGVALAAALVLPAVPAPDPLRDATVVESLVHGMPLADFARARTTWRATWPWLDWSTDGCSAPLVGDRGRTFDFAWACRRHDFAYRNLRRLGAPHWSTAARERADARFFADMRESCATRRASQRTTCERWAAIYHGTVRALGGP